MAVHGQIGFLLAALDDQMTRASLFGLEVQPSLASHLFSFMLFMTKFINLYVYNYREKETKKFIKTIIL